MKPEVWFVGSNPSAKNIDPSIPFYGTKSLLNLLSWIAYLGIKNYKFINVSNKVAPYNKVKPTKKDYDRLHSTLDGKTHIIALGGIAHKALSKLSIEHHSLPHPSPANRMHNNPNLIDRELSKCAEYLSKNNSRYF